MKLYEVNRQIEDLMLQLEPDPETGEIPANEDEVIARIDELAMKKEDILQYLAKMALSTKATALGMKEEEKRLHDRRARMDARHDRLMAVLDRDCGGEKTDLGVATLCYRKASHVEFSDENAAYEWLKENGHHDCYRIPKPELSKAFIGKLLESGKKVPGAERVYRTVCYLK